MRRFPGAESDPYFLPFRHRGADCLECGGGGFRQNAADACRTDAAGYDRRGFYSAAGRRGAIRIASALCGCLAEGYIFLRQRQGDPAGTGLFHRIGLHGKA